MKSKVSVVIPFYSGVEWLCEAVQSVIDQTYENIEIIVVNDGSPEDIQPFLDRYKDMIVYQYQDNQGAAVARNKGISLASGSYIAFEDSDDIWLPTKLEKQIGFMEENDFLWSHTGYYNWWPENGKTKIANSKYDYYDIRKQIDVSCRIAMPSVVVSKRVFEEHPEIKFPEELRKGQDYGFYKLMTKYYYLALIQEPLVKVRMRSDNSSKNILMRFEMRAKFYKDNYKSMPTIMKINGIIYVFFHSLFGTKEGRIRNFLAKCCYVIPYGISRVYIRYISKRIKKDDRYMLKYEDS